MVPLVFIRCWNGFDRGAEVDFPHPGLAEDLVRQGIARAASSTSAQTPPSDPPQPQAQKKTQQKRR